MPTPIVKSGHLHKNPTSKSGFHFLGSLEMAERKSRIPDLLKKYEAELLSEWTREHHASIGEVASRIKESDLREQCQGFLRALQEASQSDNVSDVNKPELRGVR